MQRFWKAALAIGGTATVGAFLLWSIYKQWLALPIFPQLTQDQAYKLFLWLLILTFMAFVILALIHMLPNRLRHPDSSHIFALHSSWDGVNEVDPAQLIGPDVTNAVRALAITARSWENELVPKDTIIDSHFEDFDILFRALADCQALVPGLERHNTRCSDLITSTMRRVHEEMLVYKIKKTKETK